MKEIVWLVWEEDNNPKYIIEDNDSNEWKPGEEHDLTIKRIYPLTLDEEVLLDITCEGGDIKNENNQIIDNGNENWEGTITVIPSGGNIKIGVESNGIEIELKQEFMQKEIYDLNRTIFYKTSDNQPITIFGSTSPWEYHYYDSENDYCVLISKENLVQTMYPIFWKSDTLIEITRLPDCLEEINSQFCYSCESLKYINLSNLVNLTKIGDSFCSGCKLLKNIDLSHLINLNKIGGYFCNACELLESVNLYNLYNLETIGGTFCQNCKSLKNIDLSHLINLNKIDGYFCYDCELIENINLSNLNNLREIGSSFCHGCKLIENIDLSDLINLEKIGSGFLFCPEIKISYIDFSKCINLNSIGVDPSENIWIRLKTIKTYNHLNGFNTSLYLATSLVEDYIITSPEFQNNLFDEIYNTKLKIWVHDDLYSKYIETYSDIKDHFWCIEDEEQHLPQLNTNGYEYVDMEEAGIWATCNIGASKPEEYGLYFAWGELEPKETYTWSNYKFGTQFDLKKYNTTDNLLVLESEDDVATINMGGDWRIPTSSQFKKLCDICDTIWTTKNEVNGIIFVLKTDSSKQLFFPATGYKSNSSINNENLTGNYHSSTIYISSNRSTSYELYFSESSINPQLNNIRYTGKTVRGFIPSEIIKT